jgi:hypothetical protein
MDGTCRRGGLRSLPVRPSVLALAFLGFAVGACQPGAPSDDSIRSDSAGVSFVNYSNLPPIEASRIAIADEPELVLGGGGALSGADHEFFQIRGVSQLRDGTLVVANGGSRELRFYGGDGHFLRSIGRDGSGPGEFRQLTSLWLMAGDTLVVWDRPSMRLQHFSPDGAFIRATSLVTAPFAAGFLGLPPQPQAVLEDGRAVVFLQSRSPGAGSDGIPERQPLLISLHQRDERGWDSVRVAPGWEQVFGPEGESYNYEFGAYTVAAGAGATIAVADAARFRVDLFNADGRLVSVLSAAVPAIPVTVDVIEGQIRHMVDWVPFTADQNYVERLRSAYSARHAAFLPEVRALFVDSDERIWVERFNVPGSGPSRWEVFARDGAWIGRVELPEGFARGLSDYRSAPGFSIAAGRLAGVWKDPETGVETVRVYRLIERDP